MKRRKTNSKSIVTFVVMLLIAYVILALALTCNGQELNQIQIMSCGLFAVISHDNTFDLDEFKKTGITDTTFCVGEPPTPNAAEVLKRARRGIGGDGETLTLQRSRLQIEKLLPNFRRINIIEGSGSFLR